MFRLARKSTNFPPFPLVHNAQNPWLTISEHETIEGARMALEECLPSHMWVYSVLDNKAQFVNDDYSVQTVLED